MGQIIALCGRAGSGKDTAAEMLMDITLQHGEDYYGTYALASPIKELAKKWLGWTTQHVERVEGFDREAPIYIPLIDRFYCLDILIYEMFSGQLNVTPEKAKECAASIINNLTEADGNNILSNKEGTESVLRTTPRKVLQVIGTEGFRDTIDKDFWLKCAPKGNVIITDVRFPNELEFFRDQEAMIFHIQRDNMTEVPSHESEQDLEVNLTNLNEFSIQNNGSLETLRSTLEIIYEENH